MSLRTSLNWHKSRAIIHYPLLICSFFQQAGLCWFQSTVFLVRFKFNLSVRLFILMGIRMDWYSFLQNRFSNRKSFVCSIGGSFYLILFRPTQQKHEGQNRENLHFGWKNHLQNIVIIRLRLEWSTYSTFWNISFP